MHRTCEEVQKTGDTHVKAFVAEHAHETGPNSTGSPFDAQLNAYPGLICGFLAEEKWKVRHMTVYIIVRGEDRDGNETCVALLGGLLSCAHTHSFGLHWHWHWFALLLLLLLLLSLLRDSSWVKSVVSSLLDSSWHTLLSRVLATLAHLHCGPYHDDLLIYATSISKHTFQLPYYFRPSTVHQATCIVLA